jgi:pimeloyl-ACP methyl ester carboxylesterase
MGTIEAPVLGRRVDVGGRQLWTHRAGSGAPAVVYFPGAGGFALDFLLVHERVSGATTSVLYDRAGTGWSDDVELPRSADAVTEELRAVLRAIEVPAPYLLVGHSLGGLYARRYAQRFPGDVAGLVLLDPAHEHWDRYMPEDLQLARNQPTSTELPDLPEGFVSQYRHVFAPMFAAFPESIRERLIDKHLSPERLATGFREGLNVLALFEELRAGDARPDVPLIILSGAAIDAAQTILAPEARLRAQVAGSQRLYAVLAASALHGEHRVLDDASHATIPMARPDAVAEAINDILDRVRRRGA